MSSVCMLRPLASYVRREHVRLNVDAPYAASVGRWRASSDEVGGGGWPAGLDGRGEAGRQRRPRGAPDVHRRETGPQSHPPQTRERLHSLVRPLDPLAAPREQYADAPAQNVSLATTPLEPALHLVLEDLALGVIRPQLARDG